MYQKGWDERNGGNISWILDDVKVQPYLAENNNNIRNVSLPFSVSQLANKYILVTGTGKYFKNIIDDPQDDLCLIKIDEDVKSYNNLISNLNIAVEYNEN